MKIEHHALLDVLCGEYLLGTLRGAARRRFERALLNEPLAALRLRHWQGIFTPRYTSMMEMQPSANSWKRLERELDLARYRTPWLRRTSFWRGWAAAVTVALALAIGLQTLKPAPEAPAAVEIARLEGKEITRVSAVLTRDGRTLELRAARPTVPAATKSYELWLLPAEGGAISLAVLSSLDARFALPPGQVERLRAGAKLAVTLEPAGGSPEGKATGPVILIGEIKV